MNGTEKAKLALLKYFNEDGTIEDMDYFVDSVMLTIQNTEYLYKWAKDSQRKSHTIAYEGLIETLKVDTGESITSVQLKAAFKSLGVNFKEVLKPLVDAVDDWRSSINESKSIVSEAKDTDYIICKETSEGPLYMKGKSTTLNKKEAQIFGSEEEAKEALNNYKECVADNDANKFEIKRLNEFKEEIKEGIEIECDESDLIENVDMAKIVDQINELESQLEMLGNDKEADQAEVKKIKDKIYRLNKKLDEAKMLESVDSDNTNLENIKEILQKSGIKTERTLNLMSRDILKDLKNNYDDNCKDDNGIFYGSIITDAFKKKVEQITGKKPEMKIGETKVDRLYASKQLKENSSDKITITDGTDTTVFDYDGLDFGFGDGDYFYDGNETLGQIGFFWNEEKGQKYIDSIFLSSRDEDDEDGDFEFRGSLKNKTPDQELTVTLSPEDYQTFLNWKDICDGKTNEINEAVEDAKDSDYSNFNDQIDFLVNDEKEAIEGYNNALASIKETMTEEQYSEIEKVLSHIIGEEEEHIKELNEIREKIFDYNKNENCNKKLNEELSSAEVLKRDLPLYLKTNEGYMELSIDEDPQKPEDYDEGYVTGWNKGEDPEYDKEQEEKFKEATEAYKNGEVYQLRQVVDDVIYAVAYGDKELDELLKQLDATIVNIEELMK